MEFQSFSCQKFEKKTHFSGIYNIDTYEMPETTNFPERQTDTHM